MPSEVILPRVDMDMAAGKIAKWFVEPNSKVIKGQPLFEIETDKAAMEIEAPASGTIRDMADASGADIPVGSVVAWIFAEGEAQAVPAPTDAPVHASADEAWTKAEPAVFDSELPVAATEAQGDERSGLLAGGDPGRPRATPMARRLARVEGIDLSAVTGSGPRGRIQASDVTDLRSRKANTVTATPAGPMGAAAAALVSDEPVRPTVPAMSATAASNAARQLNIVQLREGQGAPTLLIHGFGADANTWRPFLSGRPSSRPVYALDLPGHGGSPLGPVTSFDELVDAAETALADAGLGGIDLVGHSLGGGVAAALAGRGSLDVRSLLLIAPAGLGPAVNGAFVRGYLGATTEAALTPWMHELVVDSAVISAAFVRSTLKAREGTDLIAGQRHVAAAVFPDDTQAFSIRPDLARLAMPARVVVGTADKILPAAYAESLPPLVALHRLPNVGHMPQFEARDIVHAIQAQMIA